MSVVQMGRCSGALHLAIQFPKIAAAVCVLGLTGWYGLDMQELRDVRNYCKKPSNESFLALPAAIRPSMNAFCENYR